MVNTSKSTKRKTKQDNDTPTLKNTRNNKKAKRESSNETENANQKTNRACCSKKADNNMRSTEHVDDQHFLDRSMPRSKKGKEKAVDLEHDLEPMEVDPTIDMNKASFPESIVTSDTEDDGCDEDSIDWETIRLPPRFDEIEKLSQEEDVSDQKPVYKDIEIVMEGSMTRPVLKKSHWEKAYQRNLREWIHHSHVVCLIAHYKLRNKWCSDHNMQSVCSSIIPDHAKRLFAQEITESSLKTGIKWLFKWWSEYMTITGPGLLTRPFTDFAPGKVRELLDAQASNEYVDYIGNLDAFMELLVTKSCTRDTNAQLFVALLRSCNIETRLVCSLQPVPYKIPSTKESTINEKQDNDIIIDLPKPMFQYRPSYKSYVNPNIQLRQPKSKPPTIWAEVYCPDTDRWMTIDPIRQRIGSPFLMEPASHGHSTKFSWVLAFLDPYHVRDVTRRYTAHLDKALRLRQHPLTKREKQGGMKPWSNVLLQVLGDNPTSERDHRELQLLDKNQVKEVMPTAIGAFKSHPLYALERHLLKFEVLHPTQRPVLGSIRGEKIYPRSSVMTVCTAENYRKLGRIVKQGEQPVKMVKANAFTVEKKRLKEQAKKEGHDLTVACYGEWQTEPYVPPPVIDGKIPKNSFGNIDLYTPAMLPKGAVHIPIKGIAKIAKTLDIEFADAVVDFEFVKMRAVPVIDGIVVPEQYEAVLLEAWEEYELADAMKAIAKQEKDVYIRWRKLIKGLLIKARLDQMYGKTKQKEDKWASFNQQDTGSAAAGGFLPEEDNQDDV